MDKGNWSKIYIIGFFCFSILLLPHQALSQGFEEAKRFNDQVMQLYQQGKYQEAIHLAKQVLEIFENELGPDHLPVIIRDIGPISTITLHRHL